jgi:hypothetical protein
MEGGFHDVALLEILEREVGTDGCEVVVFGDHPKLTWGRTAVAM